MSDHSSTDLYESILEKLKKPEDKIWLNIREVNFLLHPEYQARIRPQYCYTRVDVERLMARKAEQVKRRLTDG